MIQKRRLFKDSLNGVPWDVAFPALGTIKLTNEKKKTKHVDKCTTSLTMIGHKSLLPVLA